MLTISPPEMNVVSMLLASGVGFIFGAIWYSPPLFAKSYENLLGEKMGKGKSFPVLLLVNFVSLIIVSFVLNHTVKYANATTIVDAMFIGAMTWFGYMGVTLILGSIMWDNKPVKLALIQGGYWLITIVLMSIILVQWP
jgi:hypothetical protein